MIDGEYAYTSTKSGFAATKKADSPLVYITAPREYRSVSRDGILITVNDLMELLDGLQVFNVTDTISTEERENKQP